MVDPSLAEEDTVDLLEWACMADPEGFVAWTDIIGQLRRAMSEDEATETLQEPANGITAEGERSMEPYETILNNWEEVLTYRAKACGLDMRYPFSVTKEGIKFRDGVSPAYAFQLLVSLGSNDAHHDGTSVYKLFEELSAAAAGQYLGSGKTAEVFGWPRSTLPPRFRDAVSALVGLLREGEGCKDREGLDQSKDDGLDIVAWREFPDRRASKLILFGQCATGRRWKEKAHELRPDVWCKNNLIGTIAVNPVPAFFVPRALSEKDADHYGKNQILLDRCRISALYSGSSVDGLDKRLREWIAAARDKGVDIDTN